MCHRHQLGVCSTHSQLVNGVRLCTNCCEADFRARQQVLDQNARYAIALAAAQRELDAFAKPIIAEMDRCITAWVQQFRCRKCSTAGVSQGYAGVRYDRDGENGHYSKEHDCERCRKNELIVDSKKQSLNQSLLSIMPSHDGGRLKFPHRVYESSFPKLFHCCDSGNVLVCGNHRSISTSEDYVGGFYRENWLGIRIQQFLTYEVTSCGYCGAEQSRRHKE
jgi:hypothetical protein